MVVLMRQTFLAYLISMHLASCGLDGQHQLEMPSHIEEPKNRNSCMLDQNGLVFKHTEVATHACSVVRAVYVPIVANNGIMV